MSLLNLERFLFSTSESQQLRQGFRLIASNVSLADVPVELRRTVPAESGCYFWTLRLGGGEYRIYLGRTRSLRRRLLDYTNDIQIHSPNDFKLRFFQELILETEPEAQFDLYFIAVSEETFKKAETDLVRQFRPLINFLRPPTTEDRDTISAGFRSYYRAAFMDRCSDANTPLPLTRSYRVLSNEGS